jgi:hypothetical protein
MGAKNIGQVDVWLIFWWNSGNRLVESLVFLVEFRKLSG